MYSQQRVVCKCNNKKGQRDANPMALFFFMKQGYYFPHFSGARHDRKIRRMEKELGLEGYAIYFKTLEILRDQINFAYPMDDIDLLADEFGTSEQKIRVVICNYELFEIDECNMFFSSKFNENMQPYLKMKEQRSLAGRSSAVARSFNGSSTVVERSLNKEKKRKEKKSKENEILIQDTHEKKTISNPDKLQVNSYFSEQGFFDESERFFDYYTANGWRVGKNPMKDWKAAARNWCKNSKTFNNGKSNQSDIEKRIANHNESIQWAVELDRARGINVDTRQE
jgi:hypothetical protein